MLTFTPYYAISIASAWGSETEICFKLRSHTLKHVYPINHRSYEFTSVMPHKQIFQPSDQVANSKDRRCITHFHVFCIFYMLDYNCMKLIYKIKFYVQIFFNEGSCFRFRVVFHSDVVFMHHCCLFKGTLKSLKMSEKSALQTPYQRYQSNR